MANFSTNQVKQLYVATDVVASAAALASLGNITVGGDADSAASQFYFQYMGRDGIVRSDLIEKDKVVYAKLIDAATMAETPENVFLTSTSAVAGQHYILRLTVTEFGGMTPEDKGFIFADYGAQVGDTADIILTNLAISLAKNVSKAAYNKLVDVYVTTQTAAGSVTLGTNAWAVSPSDTAEAVLTAHSGIAGIVVVAAPQPWSVGKQPFETVHFDLTTDKVTVAGIESSWATIAYNGVTVASIGNGQKIADLEAFAAGERGDIYRGMGYPNNFDFQPMVDPTKTYDVFELAYYYAGDAEDVQKSPKEIVVVMDSTGHAINAIASALSDYITVASLS